MQYSLRCTLNIFHFVLFKNLWHFKNISWNISRQTWCQKRHRWSGRDEDTYRHQMVPKCGGTTVSFGQCRRIHVVDTVQSRTVESHCSSHLRWGCCCRLLVVPLPNWVSLSPVRLWTTQSTGSEIRLYPRPITTYEFSRQYTLWQRSVFWGSSGINNRQ